MAIDWNLILGNLQNAGPQFTQASGAMPGGASIASRLAGANSAIGGAGINSIAGALGGVNPMAAAAPAGALAAPQAAATGFLGQAPSYLSQRLAGASTEGLGLRSLAAGSLGRAGAFGLGGQLAGGAINSAFGDPNASWDNALASAARWGGAGAGIGSLIAPGIGTAIGGALGAGVGVLKGIHDSHNEGDKAVASELNKQSGKIMELMTQLGSSTELREQAMAQLQVGAAQATNKDQVKQAAAAVQQMLPEAIIADKSQQQQDRLKQANQAAAQAWMAPMLQQSIDKSQFYADQFAQAGMSAASQITDPALRASQQQMARGYSAEQASMNAAYMAQIASAPQYWGAQQDLLSQINQGRQSLQGSGQAGQDIWAQILASQ